MSSADRVELCHVTSGNGSRITGLLAIPRTTAKAVIVLPPGYERRMHHYAVLSSYLVRHEFAVLRFDLTNHVGVSGGDICDLTMSSMAHDLGGILDAIPPAVAGLPRAIVAPSLAARAAVRAASTRDVAGLVLLLPVVDLMATLTRVLGYDVYDVYRARAATGDDKLVRVVEHDIKVRFVVDAVESGWEGVASTAQEMARIAAPIAAIAAEADDWVEAADVRSALELGGRDGHARQLAVLEATSHDVAHNPPVMRMLVEQILCSLHDALGLPRDPITHFEFDELIRIGSTERGWAKEAYGSLRAGKAK